MTVSLEEHNERRRKVWLNRTAAQDSNGIACPGCGTELIDSEPGMFLTSDPPQKHTKCPKCSYVGLRVA